MSTAVEETMVLGDEAPQLKRAGASSLAVRFFLAAAALVLVTVAGLGVGSYPIAPAEIWASLTGQPVDPIVSLILHDVRVPRTITAILVGGALGVSGLLMQTLFHNPLADPFILGVTSGSSLGVALVVLAVGSTAARTASFTASLGVSGDIAITVAAAAGACAVMLLVLFAGRFLASSTSLLLLGVMVGYFVSAMVSVMLAAASPEMVDQFTRWGFGSYHGVTWGNITVMVPILAVGLVSSLLLGKGLNALLLGERYAQTMGVNLSRMRTIIIVFTSVLAGTATAFCGPIGFLGIAIPHLCRGLFASSDHRVLLPACLLVGGALALAADVASQLPGENILPLNAVNAAFGGPVVIAMLLRSRPGGGR